MYRFVFYLLLVIGPFYNVVCRSTGILKAKTATTDGKIQGTDNKPWWETSREVTHEKA